MSGRAIPRGLIGAIALIGLGERIADRIEPDLDTPASASWRFAGRAARERSAGCAILGLGDSQVKFGVLADALQEGTGRRAYNLALYGATAPATYFQLRRVLAAGAEPEAVVVNYRPTLLAVRPHALARQWPLLLGPIEALELAIPCGSGRFVAETVLSQFLPSYRSRLELRAALASALAGREASRRPLLSALIRNWDRHAGAQATAGHPDFEPDPAGGPEPGERDRSAIQSVNARYVRRLLDLAERRGIRVFWLLPPIGPGLQSWRERSGREAAYLDFVRELASTYRNLVVVDGRHSGYDRRLLFNAAHLNGRGAANLSRDLAEILARNLDDGAADRWVALPPCDDRPFAAPPDEVDITRLARNPGGPH